MEHAPYVIQFYSGDTMLTYEESANDISSACCIASVWDLPDGTGADLAQASRTSDGVIVYWENDNGERGTDLPDTDPDYPTVRQYINR